MIIILNGTSSSGKTSIARALQAAWPGPLVYLSLDGIIGMLPFHYTGTGSHAAEGFELFEASGEGRILTGYRMGPLGRLLNDELALTAARLAGHGLDILIDHVLIDEASLEPFLHSLDVRSAYLVAVSCGLDEIERREAVRGDRMPGLARYQHARVHWPGDCYDLLVDSTAASAETLAAAVKLHVGAVPPSGLARLRERGQPPD